MPFLHPIIHVLYKVSSPVQFFRKKKKPLVCPNCYLLGKEIFVFITAYFAYLAGWLLLTLLTAYILLTGRQAGCINVLYCLQSVGYEEDDDEDDDDDVIIQQFQSGTCICMYTYVSKKARNTIIHTHTHTCTSYLPSLCRKFSRSDTIRYENVLSFVRSDVCLLLSREQSLEDSAYLVRLAYRFFLFG